MREIKPNWKIALQVSWAHTRISNRITSLIVLAAAIIALIVLKIQGHPLSFSSLLDLFWKYKVIIIPVILIIHFIPVNLYAIIKVLQHRFRHFRIVLVSTSENPHEADHRDYQTF